MKPLERLFKTEACEIFYNENLHIIQTVWNTVPVSSSEFRAILNNLVRALELKKSSMIIADARRMATISPEDQEWLYNDWFPRAFKAGFRYQGLVMAKDSYNEMAVKQISYKYDDLVITTHYFATIDEALRWIKEIQLTI